MQSIKRRLPRVDQWKEDVKRAYRSVADLQRELDLVLPSAEKIEGVRPLCVTQAFTQKIRKANPKDPLLMQVLPTVEESKTVKGFVSDPVGDKKAEVIPGVIKKYQSRVLLMTTELCAIHCRFCFRRNTLSSQTSGNANRLEKSIDAISQFDDVDEIILSGGDPLMLSDEVLNRLFTKTNRQEQVQRIRLHTRVPTALPSRIQEPLYEMLQQSRKQVVMVLHVNHPNEIGDDTVEAIETLKQAGVLLLNQSVLLKGINDKSNVLIALSKKLAEIGVTPYYLHQLDRAKGTHHFEVNINAGLRLVEEMRNLCSGYLVPRYVKEVPGAPCKSQVGSD